MYPARHIAILVLRSNFSMSHLTIQIEGHGIGTVAIAGAQKPSLDVMSITFQEFRTVKEELIGNLEFFVSTITSLKFGSEGQSKACGKIYA